MNEEKNVPDQPPEETTEPEQTDDDVLEVLGTDDIDVESALAAVASLHELALDEDEIDDDETGDAGDDAEDDESESGQEILEASDESEHDDDIHDGDDADEFEPGDDDDDVQDERETELVASRSEDVLDDALYYPASTLRPARSVLHRGQAASVIPAAMMIVGGAMLTLLVTTRDIEIDITLSIAAIVALLGVALLGYWFSSSRQTAGGFLIGTVLLLCGGVLGYLVLPNNLNLEQGWPLILTAFGTAFVLSDVMHPSPRRLWFVGLVLAVAGLSGVAVTNDLLAEPISQLLQSLLPVFAVLFGVLLLIPFFGQSE